MLYATHAPVNLSAIRRNLEAVRRLAGDREIAVAVKANAYGHGAVAVAQMVQRTGCADRLAVATVPEVLQLRAAGITLPILKLSHCFPQELPDAVRAGATLTVVDEATVRQAHEAAAQAEVPTPVHLKVDTGMRRIGTEPEDVLNLVTLIDSSPNLVLEGIFTHPPVSDMADGQDYTRAEFDRFLDVVDTVQSARGPVPLVHGAPSGAILGHDLRGMTMVRPGIMAYGYYPDASTPRVVPLEPAMSLVSRVSFVKRIRAGETVGYGRTWAADQDTWLVTVPVGYADGYSRRNSNGGRVLVGGRSCPVVGRVCMDQLMVDLGPDGAGVRAGDEVVLLGRQGGQVITADELAERMETISYEVTCLVSARVTRVYSEH
ncbi:alanine racemase [Luteococcus sp. Sow4_B9]|uniref:alanine racemase n=1 Tax=Luteococcus sp. Sow4_B9 TaxID=3438792 RepID=UPI003F9D7945